MDGINTEGNVGVLVPDGITVFLDHDVSHPTYHLTSQSARGQSVLEQRTCRQRDHAWVRWGLRQCQWMRCRCGGEIQSDGWGGRRGGGDTLLGSLFAFAFGLDFFGHVSKRKDCN
jgi:hypothetical protein